MFLSNTIMALKKRFLITFNTITSIIWNNNNCIFIIKNCIFST